ncbi:MULTISPECIES: NUDIX hydrolase [Glutamicibacter]|uniref:NUDIX domain-containing protein n=1 Tax=Glutamicibacter arilaitensis (strain DSM 16368 / CIP 108037 / IAM 15318 / JCM 13566 / NCIMB 14258 / Re117) TaxID=861360 RepID=A0ABM9PW89_GLUAR|nr:MULTISPECIES: NUDIX domain-containing protein [Glutamicibacter]CBT75550.1 NUDIX domain-containing protein [Glutamicibacter arilaitensis Re117]HCH48560.1 NUDIX hydrolase [Glutamicibacter sp.]HCJ55637.1 NUDIX hydrolase [Glutamicibacter sp.]HCM93313.1 NUDIX hydrolase [Glutamicibacter sp.]
MSSVPGWANVNERRNLPPALAVSTVILGIREGKDGGPDKLCLPLVRRIRQPHAGMWALPGGPVETRESLGQAASRNLAETTGLRPSYLEQLYTFGDIDRSPTHRLVTIAYFALLNADQVGATVQYENVAWFDIDDPQIAQMAFDHRKIVDYALWRLRNKTEYGQIAHRLLGERFTLAALRGVYEAILGRRLDPANFRRTLKSTASIEETDEYLAGGKHRPPRLYRYAGHGRDPLQVDTEQNN